MADEPHAAADARRDRPVRDDRALLGREGEERRDEAAVEGQERAFPALPDGADFVGALFGALRAGGVVVMLNPELSAEAIAALVDYLRPRFAVIDGRLAATWADAATNSSVTRRRSAISSGENTSGTTMKPSRS